MNTLLNAVVLTAALLAPILTLAAAPDLPTARPVPGGVVTIRLQEQVDNIVLAISDNGCGMDAETLQHVFDPFFTTRGTGQGTGLGLSITHRIVEDHGGTATSRQPGRNARRTMLVVWCVGGRVKRGAPNGLMRADATPSIDSPRPRRYKPADCAPGILRRGQS